MPTWTRIALVVLILLTPLLAAEIGLRALVGAHRLPFADAHRDDFEITWANLERGATPDILILGDSVAQQGIEPDVLEQLVGPAAGSEVRIFNAASPGGGFGVNAAIVEELAAEGRLPRVIVVGVATGTLSTDVTFREIFSRTVMGRLFAGCDVPMPLPERVDCYASRVSMVWRWRGRPGDIVDAIAAPLPSTESRDGLQLRDDGFRIGAGRSLARIDHQLERAVLDRRFVRLVPDVEESWRWLVEVAEANGSVVVPVTIPDTPRMLRRVEEEQPGREALFWQGIDRLEQGAGVPFVRVRSFGEWWGDGMARNFNHLSYRGARAFTRQLWDTGDFRDRLLEALENRT
jgi:hypothetical protein